MYIQWQNEVRHLRLLFPSLYPRPSYEVRNDIIGAAYKVIPGLVAIALLFAPKAKNSVQSLLKGVIVVVLIVSPLWKEGILWIAILCPFLYGIGTVISNVIEVRRKKLQTPQNQAGEQRAKINSAQWQLLFLILAFAVGAFVYRELMHERLGHTAAMFVGIPVLMAILLALTPKAKTATGGILKGITLALLIVAPLLGEGYLCILMASPLFYLAGTVVGVVMDENRKSKNARLSCLALILLPMSLEGVVPGLSFSRTQTMEVSQVVNASAGAVERQLARSPEITMALPRALRIGFPRPLNAWGQGLEIGDSRTIHFAGAEGDPPGDLIMRVAEHEAGYVRFETVSDSSKLTQWIAWDSSEVQWKRVDDRHTMVVWRVHFERQLDPAWYFAPLERAAVHEAAKYLIEVNATPDVLEIRSN